MVHGVGAGFCPLEGLVQGEDTAAGRPGEARAGRPCGAPPAAAQRGPAAGFLRLVRAVNGAPTRRLPLPYAAACRGRGREKPGLLRLGKYVQEAGRPQAARASPGQGAPQGRPPLLRSGACGRLPAPCTGCKRGAGPPLAPAPTQLPAGGGASPREVQGNLQTRRFSCKSSAVIQFSGVFPAGRPKTPVKTQEKNFRLAFFAPKDLIFRPHFAMIKGNTLSKRGTGHDTGLASADQR